MLDILQFYVSGFWVWAGVTIGLWMIIHGAAMMLAALRSMRK